MDLGILDPVKHERLIADIDHVQEMANIPRGFITKSMTEFCPADDIEFVKHFPKHKAAGTAGLLMVGTTNADTRMMAMCGAFLRNFMDARVIPLNTLLTAQEAGDVPSPTVLLIPNLYIKSVGKSLPAWKIQVLYDLLLSRYVAGKTTIAYTEDLGGMENAYGQVFADHLKTNYKMMVK